MGEKDECGGDKPLNRFGKKNTRWQEKARKAQTKREPEKRGRTGKKYSYDSLELIKLQIISPQRETW